MSREEMIAQLLGGKPGKVTARPEPTPAVERTQLEKLRDALDRAERGMARALANHDASASEFYAPQIYDLRQRIEKSQG